MMSQVCLSSLNQVKIGIPRTSYKGHQGHKRVQKPRGVGGAVSMDGLCLAQNTTTILQSQFLLCIHYTPWALHQ